MIPIPTFLMELLLFIALILLFFLPAVLELKRPKDAGPRSVINMKIEDFGLSFLLDLENIEKRKLVESFETVKMSARNPIFALANIEV